MLSPYELGFQAAVNEFETGDLTQNPYSEDNWADYVNWGIGYRDGELSCE